VFSGNDLLKCIAYIWIVQINFPIILKRLNLLDDPFRLIATYHLTFGWTKS